MRAWNITDDPRRKDIAPTQLMILQKIVKPGMSINIPDDMIDSAKLEADRKAGLIFIGDRLPMDYLQAKSPVHAMLKGKRAHGEAAKPDINLTVTKDGLKVEEEKPSYYSKKSRKR